MSLCVPTFFDDFSPCSTDGFSARVDADKYLQAIVSHEFGHLMSCLKCITDYCGSTDGLDVILSKNEEMITMYDAHSQTIRDAIALSLGTAPYISHRANPGTPAAKLPLGAELTASASAKVNSEYFAELFSYIECNSQAPDDLKTALHKIIDTWFVNDTPFLAISYDQLLERLAPLTLIK